MKLVPNKSFSRLVSLIMYFSICYLVRFVLYIARHSSSLIYIHNMAVS